jgi:hypothetical protein
MAKYLAHVPVEQYGFIEVQDETVEDVITAYKAVQEAWKGGTGLPAREFCTFMDTYLSTGKPGSIDDWAVMDEKQKFVINEVKKCLKRINK